MTIYFACPYWGLEHLDAPSFLDKITAAGYNGVEIHLPNDNMFVESFMAELDDIYAARPNFIFIPQQLISPEGEKLYDFIARLEKKLLRLASYKPTYINSHTGKDYFSFEDNCRIIDACLNLSAKTGVRILHETHRGRFSFHAPALAHYLKKFPAIELVGDFSHFCTVSESLLQGQEEFIAQIIPHVSHIHARIGFEQGPQVNDPFSPEWAGHVACFETWWKKIILHKKEKGWHGINITPEFGPAPYMPALPFTLQPVGNQWEINLKLKNHLQQTLNQ